MQFTKSQRELIGISREKIERFHLDVIEVHQDYSGVSTVLRHIEKQPWRGFQVMPRNIHLCAARPWDVVMGLVNLAGRKCHGSGYLDTVWRTLRELSGPDRRPLCLWLDEARHMKPHERELIVCLAEWTAHGLDVPVRIVMLVGKSRVWDVATKRRVSCFVHSERLDKRARKFNYPGDGLNETKRESIDQGAEPLRAIG